MPTCSPKLVCNLTTPHLLCCEKKLKTKPHGGPLESAWISTTQAQKVVRLTWETLIITNTIDAAAVFIKDF